MRCLTLADELREEGAEIWFACRNLPGNMIPQVRAKGYRVLVLGAEDDLTPSDKHEDNNHQSNTGVVFYPKKPPDQYMNAQETIFWKDDVREIKALIGEFFPGNMRPFHWLVVDHYDLDYRWENEMRACTKKAMAIDDLADRRHNCDLLLDQNLYENMENRYEGLVPAHCKALLGPEYALLRPEFKKAREKLRGRDGSIKRILVFFGGSDPTNETRKALYALSTVEKQDLAIDVVVGQSNPHKTEIEDYCNAMENASFHCQVDNMAELMLKADLAIGAGGSTTWERCYLGLPTVVILTAENQIKMIQYLAKFNAVVNLGRCERVTKSHIVRTIRKLMLSKSAVRGLGSSAQKLVCENNDQNRVAKRMLEGD